MNEKKGKGRLKALLDNMAEGVIVLDARGKITLINKVIEIIFGIREEEFLDHPLIEAIRNPELNHFLKEALDTRRVREIELKMVTPVERIFKIRSTFFREEENDGKGLLVVFNDVTEIRRLEKSRTEFIANVSHELRTPLSSIKGYVETLLEGAVDEKDNSRRFLGIIRENAIRLDRLIGDILELSKMESSSVKISKDFFELKEIAKKAVEMFKPDLKKKKIETEVNIPADFPRIIANKDMLEQVLINLLDNALKFNKEGGKITITAEEQQASLKITVKDTGFGIPAEDQPRIFERFYRVDKGRSRETGGTGLGLSIVKHIIGLHGGTVGVESRLNEGSAFYFTLPKE